jgi:dethiobiotin synthetase
VPDALVVVTGTGTAVGKTWLTAELARGLRSRGEKVSCRKPVMSFDPLDESSDAIVLAEASGEDPLMICPPHRRYELAMAPPMAAEVLNRMAFTVGDLVTELDLPDHGLALVESVGGPRSPLAADGDTVSLIERVEPDAVVLVGPSGLGALNSILTCADALAGRSGIPLHVFLNRYEVENDLHVRNRAWLRSNTALRPVSDPNDLVDILAGLVPNTLGAPARPLEVP